MFCFSITHYACYNYSCYFYVLRKTSVPEKFCEVFPVIFYGIVGASIVNIAVVTMKNAVRIWSTEKAEKVKSPRAFAFFNL